MNLFKILASGDGSINEPNVSAFLGYLINPNADHGIRDELLKRLLLTLSRQNHKENVREFLHTKKGDIVDLSANSKFQIEVLLEQAFKIDGIAKKEIVDIVILCFEKDSDKKESLAKLMISNSNKLEPKQIFLIENKIRETASNTTQLRDQCRATIDTLSALLNKSKDDILKLISVIFISPEGENLDEEFAMMDNSFSNISKCHINWAVDGETSIISFLKEILKNESEGNCDAISEISKHTIKSFISFAENDFRSSIEEERNATHHRDVIETFEEYKEKYLQIFDPKTWLMFEDFQKFVRTTYPGLVKIRHSITHPISIFLKDDGRKFFDISNRKGKLRIQLVNANHKILVDNQLTFFSTLNTLGFEHFRVMPYGIEINGDDVNYKNLVILFDKQVQLLN